MADITRSQGQSLPESMQTKYKELADGTYALVIGAVLVSDITGSPTQTDEITGALVTIPVVHHEVHEGEFFTVSYKSPDANPIADNATIDILLQLGSKYAHLVFDVACGGTAEIAFYEGTTLNDVGTNLTEVNNKRHGGETATVTATHTPNVNNVGTLLFNVLIPGGAGVGQARTGSNVRANTEWILAPNTNYLVRGINRAGNAQPMSNVCQWYEETDN